MTDQDDFLKSRRVYATLRSTLLEVANTFQEAVGLEDQAVEIRKHLNTPEFVSLERFTEITIVTASTHTEEDGFGTRATSRLVPCSESQG